MTTRHEGRPGPTPVTGDPADELAGEPVFAELADAFAEIPTGSVEREHLAAMFEASRGVQARSRRRRRLVPAGPVEVPAARRFAGVAAGVLVAVSIGVGVGGALGLGPWAPRPATIPASPSAPEASLTPALGQSRTPEPEPTATAKDSHESTATARASDEDSTPAGEGAGTGKKSTPRPSATRGDSGDDGGEAGDAGDGERTHEDSGAEDAGEG